MVLQSPAGAALERREHWSRFLAGNGRERSAQRAVGRSRLAWRQPRWVPAEKDRCRCFYFYFCLFSRTPFGAFGAVVAVVPSGDEAAARIYRRHVPLSYVLGDVHVVQRGVGVVAVLAVPRWPGTWPRGGRAR